MTQKGAESVLARPLPPVPPPGPLMLLPPPTGMPPGPNAPVALLPAIPTCGDRGRRKLGWNALVMMHALVNKEITEKFAKLATLPGTCRNAELSTCPKYVICAERPKRRAESQIFHGSSQSRRRV
jgi:hypothetical protein